MSWLTSPEIPLTATGEHLRLRNQETEQTYGYDDRKRYGEQDQFYSGSRTREYLCVLFGYCHSESPIEQETKNMYQTMFFISFSSKNDNSALNIIIWKTK